MENIVLDYFEAWNSRDLVTLRGLMHEDVRLKDWLNDVCGINSTLSVNSKIYEQFPNVKIEIMDIGICGNVKVMAQLKIELNQEEMLDVVDVFTIYKNKIQSIIAYKV